MKDYKGPVEYSIEIAIEKIGNLLKRDYFISKRSLALLLLQGDKEIIEIVREKEQDILPHKNAIADDPYAGMEEERRLCYVGATRSKKILFLSYCNYRRRFGKYGNQTKNKCKPSQFLYEMGLLKKK